jgi:hypothetical protein
MRTSKDLMAMASLVMLAACSNGASGANFDGDGNTEPGASEGGSEGGDGDGESATEGSDGGSDETDEPDEGARFDVGEAHDLPGEDENDYTCDTVENVLSSAGCEFAPMVGNQNPDLAWAVVAANPSSEPATVQLFSSSGELLEIADVAPSELHVFELAAGSEELDQHQFGYQTGLEYALLRLESDVPVVAYQFAPYASSEVAVADASMLLPTHVWDDDHFVGYYANDGTPWIMIVSTEDDNELTITAPDDFAGGTAPGAGLSAFSAGQSQALTVDAGATLRLSTDGAQFSDLTGFHIASSKPIGLFVGAPTMSVPGPSSNDFRDYLEEQVPPRAAWGSKYAAVKFRERGGEIDVYRFIAGQDGTSIELSGGVVDLLALDAGEYVDVETSESFIAESDAPFLLEHLMVSQDQTVGPKDEAAFPGEGQSGNCWGDDSTTHVGDPSVTFIPAIEQYRKSYTFLTPATFAWDALTVVGQESDWDLIELDGAPLPEAPTPLGADGWAWASFAISDGPHTIDSPSPIGIEVYGYDCHISYAYPGGMYLNKINPEG